ncbi:hypothetical protein Dimus_013829 [Dionaea muscipula]
MVQLVSSRPCDTHHTPESSFVITNGLVPASNAPVITSANMDVLPIEFGVTVSHPIGYAKTDVLLSLSVSYYRIPLVLKMLLFLHQSLLLLLAADGVQERLRRVLLGVGDGDGVGRVSAE